MGCCCNLKLLRLLCCIMLHSSIITKADRAPDVFPEKCMQQLVTACVGPTVSTAPDAKKIEPAYDSPVQSRIAAFFVILACG